MAMLAIEGVTLPASVDGFNISGETVGEAQRNAVGHRLMERRREKLVLEFSLVPKTLHEAMLYRCLVLGEGELFDTLTAYGSKGYPLTGTGTLETSGGGNPHNGNGVWKLDPTETLTIPGVFYDQSAVASQSTAFGASAVMWRRDDASGAFKVFGASWRRYDTTATYKREALGTSGGLGTLGAAGAFTGGETFAVSSGALTITAGAGGPFRYSNIRVLPWFLPEAQLDQLILGRNVAMYTLPQLPRVYVQTDLLPVDLQKGSPVGVYDSSLVCHGEISSQPIVPSMQSGTFTTTVLGMSGRLIEV